MVNIPIKDTDALQAPLLLRAACSNCDIVKEAEPSRAILVRVVTRRSDQAEGTVALPAHNGIDTINNGSCRKRGSLACEFVYIVVTKEFSLLLFKLLDRKSVV